MGTHSAGTLNVANNQLKQISDGLGRLQKLRMLDLGHNRLSTLPDAIGRLQSLSDLST